MTDTNERLLDVGLVLSGHVASCPRAVKFADALHAAGLAVRVFAIQHTDWVSALDRELLGQRPWPATLAPHPVGMRRRLAAAEQRLVRGVWRLGLRSATIAGLTERRWVRPLVAEASPFRARLWIAFNVPGMLAAERLARRDGVPLVIDVEDDHIGILPEHQTSERARLDCILRPLMRAARHRISTSLEMADMLRRRFQAEFQIIHNVPEIGPHDAVSPTSAPRSVYWCSQTIGPDRGLEEFLPILARLPGDVTMALLGRVDAAYRERLLGEASAQGIAPERFEFIAPVPPGQMLAVARRHRIGLALENGLTENHRICLPNKIFDYLAAGLPVAMSATPAQARLAGELGAAARVIHFDRPDAAAADIRQLFDDEGAWVVASRHALAASRERFCWEVEQRQLVAAITPLLDRT